MPLAAGTTNNDGPASPAHRRRHQQLIRCIATEHRDLLAVQYVTVTFGRRRERDGVALNAGRLGGQRRTVFRRWRAFTQRGALRFVARSLDQCSRAGRRSRDGGSTTRPRPDSSITSMVSTPVPPGPRPPQRPAVPSGRFRRAGSSASHDQPSARIRPSRSIVRRVLVRSPWS